MKSRYKLTDAVAAIDGLLRQANAMGRLLHLRSRVPERISQNWTEFEPLWTALTERQRATVLLREDFPNHWWSLRLSEFSSTRPVRKVFREAQDPALRRLAAERLGQLGDEAPLKTVEADEAAALERLVSQNRRWCLSELEKLNVLDRAGSDAGWTRVTRAEDVLAKLLAVSPHALQDPRFQKYWVAKGDCLDFLVDVTHDGRPHSYERHVLLVQRIHVEPWERTIRRALHELGLETMPKFDDPQMQDVLSAVEAAKRYVFIVSRESHDAS